MLVLGIGAPWVQTYKAIYLCTILCSRKESFWTILFQNYSIERNCDFSSSIFIFSSLSACRVLPWVLPWRSRKFQPPSQATLLSESGDWGKKENFKLCGWHQPPLPRQVRRPPSYKVSLCQPPLIVGCNIFRIKGVETIFEDLIYLKDTSRTWFQIRNT